MRTCLIFATLLLAALLTSGCENEGPMEQAGEAVDEAAKDVGNAIEDACEEIKEGANADDQNC